LLINTRQHENVTLKIYGHARNKRNCNQNLRLLTSTEFIKVFVRLVTLPFSTRYKEESFHNEGGETLAQVAHRGCRRCIPGNIQGQVGWGSEQPGVVEDVLARCRGIGLGDL